MEKESKLVVVKSNEVISSSYRLSLNEQRIILTCISKIDSTSELTKEQGITIRVDEIKDLLVKTRNDTGSFYNDLKTATDKLYERSIVLDGEGSKRRWVYEVTYNHTEGSITLFFSPTIIPYLSELKGNFTKYKLENISNFKSAHSIRIYELLCQWSFIGEREIELEELKKLLGLEDKYSERPANFIRRVIDVAKNDINNHSNIHLEYGLRKTGRKITHIQLKFDMKKSKKGKKAAKNTGNITEFVRDNEKLTRGKSEWEIKKLMSKN